MNVVIWCCTSILWKKSEPNFHRRNTLIIFYTHHLKTPKNRAFNFLHNSDARGSNYWTHTRILSQLPFLNKVYICLKNVFTDFFSGLYDTVVLFKMSDNSFKIFDSHSKNLREMPFPLVYCRIVYCCLFGRVF